jgi:hypothetical protein
MFSLKGYRIFFRRGSASLRAAISGVLQLFAANYKVLLDVCREVGRKGWRQSVALRLHLLAEW